LLEFYIKTYSPEVHIQICELISLTLTKILVDKMGDDSDDFYGMFLLRSGDEVYELFTEFQDITLEMPKGKVIR
jgi:hypothetical protein